MNTVVKNLVKLQEFDSRLNDLKLQKGDLPFIIENLNEDLTSKEARQKELNDTIAKLQNDRSLFQNEIAAGKEQLKKFEEKLYHVKNNKEYDAISLEIDTKKVEIESLENKVIQTLEEEEELKKETAELSEMLKQLNQQLEENRAELAEIDMQTKEEEARLLQERKKVADLVEKRYFQQYERIRQAKNGLAVAHIRRSSCGGCFSAVPPQRIVEIRQGGKLHTCEYCGRILVWDED